MILLQNLPTLRAYDRNYASLVIDYATAKSMLIARGPNAGSHDRLAKSIALRWVSLSNERTLSRFAIMSDHIPPQDAPWPKSTIFTVGHSTLPFERFVELLKIYGIEQLIDIRTIPGSRHNPQFGSEALAGSLKAAHIEYAHMGTLGGLRRARKDSPNDGWRNKSFRGYADYMQTAEFSHAVETLVRMGRQKRTAIMCAEAVPWRCHRSLVADALDVRGVPVIEILSEASYRSHKLTSFAQVDGTSIIYPSEQLTLGWSEAKAK